MASRLWYAIAVLTLATAAQAGVWQGKGPRDRSLRRPPPAQLSYNHVPLPLIRKEEDLPKNHDWCNLDGTNFCTASWNQHIPEYCGSCWVHGSLSMVQDRLKILKKAKGTDVMLGRQTLLNCAHFDGHGNGCDGGDTWDVFSYMTDSGLPDEGCLPYNATDHIKYGVHAKECPTHGKCMNCMPIDGKYTCWAIKKPVMYHLTNWGKVEPIKGQPYELAMMNEIYERGPITCGMVCPEDFTWDYKGGIYHDTSDETELDHDVEVVGWGEENGVKFWKVRNSWGAYWGELGFFRVERGHNGLQLESGDCWYAIPENSMERSIASGELHGSMWGVRKSKAGDSPDGPDAGDDVIHQKQEEEEHEERDDGDDDNDDREEEKHHSHKHRHSHEDKHAGKQSGHDAEDGEDAEVPEWHADGPKGTERMAHIKLGHADRVAANYRRLMGHQL